MENATFTEFLRDPNEVIGKLRGSRGVVLERRGAPSLVLSLQSGLEDSRLGSEMVAHLLAKVLESNRQLSNLLKEALEEKLPWVRLLPPEDSDTFLREFLKTAEACASAGNTAALAQLVHEWKATAEVHADPALAARLKRPLPAGTGRAVARPPARARR
jgi:hypothetical protein